MNTNRLSRPLILVSFILLCITCSFLADGLIITPVLYKDAGVIKASFMHRFPCEDTCGGDDILHFKILSPEVKGVELGKYTLKLLRSDSLILTLEGTTDDPHRIQLTLPRTVATSTTPLVVLCEYEVTISEPVNEQFAVEFTHTSMEGAQATVEGVWDVQKERGQLIVKSSPLTQLRPKDNSGDQFLQFTVNVYEGIAALSTETTTTTQIAPPQLIHPLIKSITFQHFSLGALQKDLEFPCTVDGTVVSVESNEDQYTLLPEQKQTTGEDDSQQDMITADYLQMFTVTCPIIYKPSVHDWSPEQYIVHIEYLPHASKTLPTIAFASEALHLPYQPIITPKSSYYPGMLFCVFDFTRVPDAQVMRASVNVRGVSDATAFGKGHLVLSAPSKTMIDGWDAVVRQSFSMFDHARGQAIDLHLDAKHFDPKSAFRLTYEIPIDPTAVKESEHHLGCGNIVSIPDQADHRYSYTSQSFSHVVNSQLTTKPAKIDITSVRKSNTIFDFELTLPKVAHALKGVSINLPLYTPYNFPEHIGSCTATSDDSKNPLSIDSMSTRILTITGEISQGVSITVTCKDNKVLDVASTFAKTQQFFVLFLGNDAKNNASVHGGTLLFNLQGASKGGGKSTGLTVFLVIFFILVAVGVGAGVYFYLKKRRAAQKTGLAHSANRHPAYNQLV